MQRISIVLALAALSTGCATFDPAPVESVPFLERAVSETRGPLRVTVAVPTREESRKLFGELGIWPEVPPHGETSGFAFSNLELGTKEVRIRLFGDQQVEDFAFFVTVPGLRADWQQVDPDDLYLPEELVFLETEQQLYDAVASLPCCTTRQDGTGEGVRLEEIDFFSWDVR